MTNAISGAGSSLLTQLFQGAAIQNNTQQPQTTQKPQPQKQDTVHISDAAQAALKLTARPAAPATTAARSSFLDYCTIED